MAAETLASIKARVSSVIQDTPGFLDTGTGGLMEDAIQEALETYSNDVPYLVTADFAGDGLAYDFALPATYIDGPSNFLQLEFPAGNRIPVYMEDDDWRIYRTATTTMLRLVGITPGTGETLRASFTSTHTINQLNGATVTTIPTYHTLAFVYLCASKCLTRLANRFLHEQESTFNMDSVNRGSKSADARLLAKSLLDAYRAEVGEGGIAGAGSQVPAVGRIDYDWSLAGITGLELTHSRRRR